MLSYLGFREGVLRGLLALFCSVNLAGSALAAFAAEKTASILPGTGSAAKNQPSVVLIDADQQRYDPGQAKSFLKGHVRVSYQNLKINGSEATVDMDDSGAPLVANFYKRPYAKRKELNKQKKWSEDTLVGDIIRIYLNENAMTAHGNVVSYVTTVAAEPVTIHSDVQQFDNKTKTMVAEGKVAVDYKEGKAFSPKAILQVGPNGKAEKVVFTGGARLEKENSTVTGEKITIMVASGNLIAEKNVKTNVIQKESSTSPGSKVQIFADYQQYDKPTETVLASGNVRILYQDYVAVGPKATFKLKNNQVESIILTGRGNITEKDRNVIADTIVITTNPKNFNAFGNVKTKFVSSQSDDAGTSSKAAPASTSKPSSGKAAPAKSTAPAPAKPFRKPLSTEELEDE